MNIESQVTSLELSKRLKELNIEQNSLFCWLDGINREEYRIFPNEPCFPALDWQKGKHKTHNDGYSAFTVAELLELLPLVNGCPLQLLKGCRIEFGILYAARYDSLAMHYSSTDMLPDKNPSNALAKMLIYLLETGLIKND